MSEEANLPPSSWTIGLKSAGITGKSSKIVASGLTQDVWKATKIFNLLNKKLRYTFFLQTNAILLPLRGFGVKFG